MPEGGHGAERTLARTTAGTNTWNTTARPTGIEATRKGRHHPVRECDQRQPGPLGHLTATWNRLLSLARSGTKRPSRPVRRSQTPKTFGSDDGPGGGHPENSPDSATRRYPHPVATNEAASCENRSGVAHIASSSDWISQGSRSRPPFAVPSCDLGWFPSPLLRPVREGLLPHLIRVTDERRPWGTSRA